MSDADSPVKAPPRKIKRVIESDDDEPVSPKKSNGSNVISPPAKKAKVNADFFKPKSKQARSASPEKSPSPKKEAKPEAKSESKKEAEVGKREEDKKVEKRPAANGKPLASIFAKPAKKEEPEDNDEAFINDDEEGEDELSDEELEEQEEKAAVKLAAIFTKDFKSKVADKGWKEGEPVPYAALVATFEQIEATTKRLEILNILTQFLLVVAKRDTDPGGTNLLKTVYLCINRLCPDYEGLELGIGEMILMKAIAESTGRNVKQIKEDLKKEGDLGKVAMASRNNQKTLFKPKPLTVTTVFQRLTNIAKTSGNQSQAKKVGFINQLLSACQGNEAKFIIRSLEGKLRIGLAERSLVVALAHAIVLKDNEGKKLSPEAMSQKLDEGAEIVKAVYSELPTYDIIVPALMKGGVHHLRENCKLTPGVPLKPMLAKPTKAITEVLDRFEGKMFTCEYKYDGERAQVHLLEDGTIAVFSRNSENMSAKYPDMVEQIPRCIKEGVKSFVLDAEAVAYDVQEKKLLPFQELSRRKRKDVKAEDITVRVHLFAFDLLYLNGESLLQKELRERREILKEHFNPVESEFGFAKASDSSSTEEISAFLDESIKDGCEGLMVKMLTTDSSTYEPSRRSMNWLKLKKDYLEGVGDSLDLVVVGAYYGKGKRTNWYGAYLLACYDPDSENFQTICKIGTGFSEEQLKAQYEELHPLEMSKPRGDIEVGGAKPDVWFEPKIVWEVLTADLSLSPVYTAAHGLIESRGISLRFPRFIRQRDDKDADDATTAEQVAEFYQRQATAGNKKGGGNAEDYW
ncbi:putative DNA ligase [Cutaneotrichosporon oleaginosum]|uniref:DNA ligase n=1 Tax=Cutaneotrichosporon oleaginosum TaxID=879819 RepID=A0A0J0XXA4_9TREE|nr:putative DNA ligase [Cutaneotrichosporon oleaginosum]KLT45696.1 putative DNA ligase [Cutaneotrichosporon oleaginosum]